MVLEKRGFFEVPLVPKENIYSQLPDQVEQPGSEAYERNYNKSGLESWRDVLNPLNSSQPEPGSGGI